MVSNGYFKENYIFSKVSEEVQHFPRGSNFFRGGGVQVLISIETHITCDFPGCPDTLSPSRSAHEHYQSVDRYDPDQARRTVGPDLGRNCLQSLSAPLAD